MITHLLKPTLSFNSIDDAFNQTLLDALPGVFFLYLIEDNTYKMKRWNQSHVDLYGYSPEESYDKSPFFYLDPAYHELAENAIRELIRFGEVKQVFANVVTKAGESIPLAIEGYKLRIKDQDYFLGMGIVISNLFLVKDQLQLLEYKTNQIINENRKKEKQLLALALQEKQNDRLIHTLSRKIDNVTNCEDLETIKDEVQTISAYIKSQETRKDNWDKFKNLFVNIHHNFFSNLKDKHPELTEGELRFCAYLKIKMSSNNLCTVLNISKVGLKKKRYRLRKKLNIDKIEALEDYIYSI